MLTSDNISKRTEHVILTVMRHYVANLYNDKATHRLAAFLPSTDTSANILHENTSLFVNNYGSTQNHLTIDSLFV